MNKPPGFKTRKTSSKALRISKTCSKVSMQRMVPTVPVAKLMELANCGDPKFELKALELLGKHSDIGLFTERSEITVNYKSSGDLENAIKERVRRLLNADIVDVTPIGEDLDAELGVVDLGEIKE